MSTEMLSRRNEQLEIQNTTLAELEGIIEGAAAELSPEELAILNAPNPMAPELQVADVESAPDEVFSEILSRTPEVEAPNHSHGRKLAVVHEGNGGWNYRGL